MDTVETATAVEEKLNSLLDHPTQGNADPFTLGDARLYGVLVSEGEPSLTFLSSNEDVYALLEDKSSATGRMFDYVGIVTTGWAAPINPETGEPDGRPSEHAMRRRVRLMVLANAESMASVLRFKDEPDAVVTDAGVATGALADAVREFLS